ncbi:MAG: response regulator transcription factor [Bryobacterales bacterium]
MLFEKQTRTPAGRSSDPVNGGGLIRVVIQSPEIWGRRDLSRHFSAKQGFVLLEQQGSLDEILTACEKMAPCVLLVDQVLVQTEGLDLDHFGARVEYGRSIQVLVVGPKRDPRLVEDLLRIGCVGFITQDASPAVLKKAVRVVAGGEFWADRRATSRVVQQLLSQSGSRNLTPRERQVLWLIGQGLKNRAIADRLYITRDTVRWHIRSVYSKIGVHDRLSAAFYAQEHLADGIGLELRPVQQESLLVDSLLTREAGPQPRLHALDSRFRNE